MSNEEILNLWDCNKLTCGEVVEVARADERKKVLDEFKEKMRNLNQLNCFVDYVGDEIDLEELMYYASEEIAEQLKNREV